MADKKTEVAKNFIVKLKSFEVGSFEITDFGQKIKSPIPDDQYEFKWDIRVTFGEEKREIIVYLKTTVRDKANNSVDLVTLNTNFTLDLKNSHEFINPETKKAQLPQSIIPIISEIGISTTRGILLMKVSDTIFSNALIPLTDANTVKINKQNPSVST